MVKGEKVDFNDWLPYMEVLSKDVAFQKKQVGGDFAVTMSAMKRNQRDHFKKFIPDCIFIVLTLSPETQQKRMIARHGTGPEGEKIINAMTRIFKNYEGPESDEKRAHEIVISEDMTQNDVLNRVLQILKVY